MTASDTVLRTQEEPMRKRSDAGSGGGLRLALLMCCGLLSIPSFVGAGEPLVSAGTRVRVSTGPEVRMQEFRITAGYMKGRPVVEDSETLTFELDGRALRLARPNVQLSGTVQAIDDETLTLAVERHASPIVIPRDAIAKFETALGRRRHAKKGAIIGGAFGLTTLSALLAMCSKSDLGGCGSDIGNDARYVAFFTGLGALIGAAIRGDKWVVVPARPVKVGLRSEPRAGLNLSFALRF